MAVLAEPIQRLLEVFNPESDRFFLKVAFIPSEGYFEDFTNDIKTVLESKFGFVAEIREFLGNIFGIVINTDPEPPDFSISLPGGKWGSGKVKVIDFSMFAQYRTFILNFMRVLLWIPFLIKLYKRLPSMIYQ